MTSRPLDVLVAIDRESPRTLGRQIEDQLRHAIRDLTLRPGARLPSTRDLARELGISRPIVVDAYAQLAGEGYLELRPGTKPRVTGCAGPSQPSTTRGAGATSRCQRSWAARLERRAWWHVDATWATQAARSAVPTVWIQNGFLKTRSVPARCRRPSTSLPPRT